MEKQSKKKLTKGDIICIVILAVLAIILIPIFAINFTLIIKGSIRPEVPPDVFGIAPMAVTTGSMEGDREDGFSEGALIFVSILDDSEKQRLSEGDIVTFRLDRTYVTHRIESVVRGADGSVVSVITRGDTNNTDDGAIPLENVIGLCTGSIAGAGSFAMFMQTPLGIVIVVGIPILLYIVYDVTRITIYNRRVKADAETDADSEKDKEIRRLQQLLAEKESGVTSVQEDGQDTPLSEADSAEGGSDKAEHADQN